MLQINTPTLRKKKIPRPPILYLPHLPNNLSTMCQQCASHIYASLPKHRPHGHIDYLSVTYLNLDIDESRQHVDTSHNNPSLSLHICHLCDDNQSSPTLVTNPDFQAKPIALYQQKLVVCRTRPWSDFQRVQSTLIRTG